MKRGETVGSGESAGQGGSLSRRECGGRESGEEGVRRGGSVGRGGSWERRVCGDYFSFISIDPPSRSLLFKGMSENFNYKKKRITQSGGRGNG